MGGDVALSTPKSRQEVSLMKRHAARWEWSVAVALLSWFLSATSPPAQAWETTTAGNSVSGEAFGVSVNLGPTVVVVVPKTPDVVLPPDGGLVATELLTVSVPDALASDTLKLITSGAIGANSASAQSSATVENLNVRNGLVTAKLVVAMASSTGNGSTATSNAEGSTLVGLTVNGVPLGDITPAPNTPISIDGVGTVFLNEQVTGGDGVSSTSLTVNMIHIVLTGAEAGHIIVASAHSDVNFAPAPVPPPVTGFMTGGGRLGTGRNIATFGFHAGPSLQGQLQFTDHAQGLSVHSTGITGYSSLGGTCVTAAGIAQVNKVDGYHFTVNQACDNGEPGVGHDTFEVSVKELSYSSQSLGTVLTGGNLQLH
jgi:hypothetical protein